MFHIPDRLFSQSTLFVVVMCVWLGGIGAGIVLGAIDRGRITDPWLIGVGMFGLGVGIASLRRPRYIVSTTMIIVALIGVLLGQYAFDPEEMHSSPGYPDTPVSRTLSRAIGVHLPMKQANLMSAMVLNTRQQMTPLFRQQLRITGTTHIVAISGQNIVMLVAMFSAILYALGVSRFWMVLIMGVFLWGYMIVIAAPPPAVRASIMGIVVLISVLHGRGYGSIHSALFAAAIMLVIDPMALASVSFQLSFLAVLAIMLLKKPCDHVFSWVPKQWMLRDIISISFAVQLLLWPLSAYYFQTFSLIGPISNLFVLPALPVVMGATVIGLGVHFVWPALAGLIFVPVWLGAGYVIWTIEELSRLKFALLTVAKPSLAMLIGYYVVIAVLYILFHIRHGTTTNTS